MILTVVSGIALLVIACFECRKNKKEAKLNIEVEKHWDLYFAHEGLYPYQWKEVRRNDN